MENFTEFEIDEIEITSDSFINTIFLNINSFLIPIIGVIGRILTSIDIHYVNNKV